MHVYLVLVTLSLRGKAPKSRYTFLKYPPPIFFRYDTMIYVLFNPGI